MMLCRKRKHPETPELHCLVAIGRYPIRAATYSWVPCPGPNDPLPDNMVCGGQIETGELSYIARGPVGDQLPSGFFTKEARELHVGCNWLEHKSNKFDILVMNDKDAFIWKKCSNGRPPRRSPLIPLLSTKNLHPYGEIYVGRTCTPLTNGMCQWTIQLEVPPFAKTGQEICRPGKIHQSHGCLYVPYCGREYQFYPQHEMLMLKISPGLLKHICRYAILNCLKPRPTKGSINELPLPNKIKEFLGTEPEIPR